IDFAEVDTTRSRCLPIRVVVTYLGTFLLFSALRFVYVYRGEFVGRSTLENRIRQTRSHDVLRVIIIHSINKKKRRSLGSNPRLRIHIPIWSSSRLSVKYLISHWLPLGSTIFLPLSLL